MAKTTKQKTARTCSCADLVPDSWLDAILTGPQKALHGTGGTWGCPDIERLMRAVKDRITRANNTMGPHERRGQ